MSVELIEYDEVFVLEFRDLVFDAETGQLSRAGEEIYLRQKLSQLLAYFLINSNRVISKEELLKALWVHGEYREKALSQSILELRKALGDSAANPVFIKTVPNKGYQWICPVIQQTPKKQLKPGCKALVLALVVIALLILTYVFYKPEQSDSKDFNHIMVLPFSNETQSVSMQWVEFGLSDMMASDLQLIPNLTVTTPAQANALMAVSGAVEIEDKTALLQIMNSKGIDVAVLGEVRLAQEQQVFAYHLLFANGESSKGQIFNQDLAVAMPKLAQAIYQLIQPQSTVELTEHKYLPNAMHDYGRGIQALQTEGAVLARHYFNAAVQLDPQHHWAKAYLAVCHVFLGRWPLAESILGQLILNKEDKALQGFATFWLGEISFRRGNILAASDQFDQSLDLAKFSNNKQLMSWTYRMQALLAGSHMDWSAYRTLSASADDLFPYNQDVNLEALRLFHLGSTQVHGLEYDPKSRLFRDFQKLKQAQAYFERVENKPQLATTLLSIARNPAVPQEERIHLYQRAIDIYQSLQQPYGLAKALQARAIFAIQEYRGKAALEDLSRAHRVSSAAGSDSVTAQIGFYLAFAQVDIALTEPTPKNMDTALIALNNLATSDLPVHIKPLLPLLRGWLHLKTKKTSGTINEFQLAKDMAKADNLSLTLGYANHALMYQRLMMKDYHEVISLGTGSSRVTKLEYLYLAYAYLRSGNRHEAVRVYQELKFSLSEQWSKGDENMLESLAGDTGELPDPIAPYRVYGDYFWIKLASQVEAH